MRFLRLVVVLIFCLVLSNMVFAQVFNGRDIMESSFNRYDGNDSLFEIEMVLIDKNGGERIRNLKIYSKDYENLTKSSLTFTTPADIEGTCFLSWENEGEDDTQYLYLPALNRARRIVSSQKKARFVNTDYTYEDMQRRRPDKDTHRLLGYDRYLSRACFVVESIPTDKKNSQYTKRISWVDKQSFVVVKIDFYDKKNKVTKRFSIETLEKRDNIWTSMQSYMEDLKEDHSTLMTVLEVLYNQGVEDEMFSLRRLEEK